MKSFFASFSPGVIPPELLALRARLLRPLLLASACIACAYLMANASGLIATRLYPWDGLWALLWCGACALLLRRGTERSAAFAISLFVAMLAHMGLFNVPEYGAASAAGAIVTLSIAVAGLLVGGWFLRAWTAVLTLMMIGIISVQLSGRVGTPPAVEIPDVVAGGQIAVFWVTVNVAMAWITAMFAGNFERAIVDAKRAEAARQSAIRDERNRMARDMHDTLAQGFSGVILQLEACEDAQSTGDAPKAGRHLERARQLARDSLSEARRSIFALRPVALERKTLIDALADSAHALLDGSGARVLVSAPAPVPQLPPAVEDDLLRVGQEALTNARKYARASRVEIGFRRDAGHAVLTIEDDGMGFDADALVRDGNAQGGLGVLGMRERVERHQGVFELRSNTQGTRVTARVPLT